MFLFMVILINNSKQENYNTHSQDYGRKNY
jgi:hypothetical protein